MKIYPILVDGIANDIGNGSNVNLFRWTGLYAANNFDSDILVLRPIVMEVNVLRRVGLNASFRGYYVKDLGRIQGSNVCAYAWYV